MEPIITAAESRRLDAEAGTEVSVLMERAGLAVALAAVDMGVGYGDRVAVLAGRGNNGGDGYVAARHLRGRGVAVTVHALGDPEPGSVAGQARDLAVASGVRVVALQPPTAADLVIDAIFGVGFRGRLPDPVVPWTTHPAPVLAVDVVSGCQADTGDVEGPAFTAARTVTFGARKPAHVLGEGARRSGPVTVVDIGLPQPRAELHLVTDDDALRPVRARDAHKWSAGAVLVVGGAPGMSGAPLLAARAALRFGAGAVRLAVPGSVVERVAAAAPEIMVTGSRAERFTVDDANDLATMGNRFDVLVIGPGLGRESDPFARLLLDSWTGGKVVDADALAAAGSLSKLDDASTVITPHKGEWQRLTNLPATPDAVLEACRNRSLTVLLKGSPTLVFGEAAAVVTSGGPELATIGTGDVLAGMIGALVARGLDVEEAARSAAYWHGVAASALAAEGTVTADRLADAVGRWAW